MARRPFGINLVALLPPPQLRANRRKHSFNARTRPGPVHLAPVNWRCLYARRFGGCDATASLSGNRLAALLKCREVAPRRFRGLSANGAKRIGRACLSRHRLRREAEPGSDEYNRYWQDGISAFTHSDHTGRGSPLLPPINGEGASSPGPDTRRADS